jgi:hypothetical protein
LLAVLALLATLLIACGDDNDSPEPTTSESPDPNGSETATPSGSAELPAECEEEDTVGLLSELDFQDGDEYTRGGQFDVAEEINARMRLINCTNANSTLYFETAQRYEMVVEEEEAAREVFRSSDGQEFAEEPGTEVMAPGETITYEQAWAQTDKDGAQVPPGVYKVSFLSVGCGVPEAEDCPNFGPISRIEIVE